MKAKAWLVLAALSEIRGDPYAVVDACTAAHQLLSATRQGLGLANCLYLCGATLQHCQQHARGRDLIEQAIQTCEAVVNSPLSPPSDVPLARLQLANIHVRRSQDVGQATKHLSHALRELGGVGGLKHQRTALLSLGAVAVRRGDWPSAAPRVRGHLRFRSFRVF